MKQMRRNICTYVIYEFCHENVMYIYVLQKCCCGHNKKQDPIYRNIIPSHLKVTKKNCILRRADAAELFLISFLHLGV